MADRDYKAEMDKALAHYKDRQGKSSRKGRWESKFRAQEAQAKNVYEDAQKKYNYQQSLSDVDESTVSGRMKKKFGMDALADPKYMAAVKGAEMAESVIGPEGLGRLGDDDEVLAVQAQYKERMKGYDSKQMQAMREQAGEQITGSTEAQSRALEAQMARSGVKGMQGAFQQSQLRQGAVKAKADVERDLMIKQHEATGQALDKYSDVTGRIKSFDISQAAKEKDIALQAGMGFMNMESVEKQAKLAADAQRAAARASKAPSCFIEGTKIIMADNSVKNIEDIKLGDRLKFGGIVYSLHTSLTTQICKYKDVQVTGSHAVLEDEWIRVENSPYAEVEEGIFTVYNLGTEFHRIVADSKVPGGILFSDADETDFGTKLSDDESLEALNGKRAKLLPFGRGL